MLYTEENIIMARYGYTINDECFEDNDDWRNLFDLYIGSKRHNELVDIYIAPVKHQEFIIDLNNFDNKLCIIQNKINELAEVLDCDESDLQLCIEKFINKG